MLPDYISKNVPNAASNRAPWYVNTAPSYAGIFLWVAFYMDLAKDTIRIAGFSVLLPALVVAGLLCFALYYYVPAMLGMKTGRPLYVVGSSTFGTTGGYLMPGLLMGLLQVGWFAVATFFSTQFILKGLKVNDAPKTLVFAAVAIVWGYVMAFVGVKGIKYVAKVSLFLNLIPLLMVILVFLQTQPGLAQRHLDSKQTHPLYGALLLIGAVIGFFATAGAAGADFGMSNRSRKDVVLGGLVGITLAVVIAAGLPLLSVGGALADGKLPQAVVDNKPLFDAAGKVVPDLSFGAVIGSTGGLLATAMFFLFAIASITPNCFCAFIAANSFSTMLPRVPRMLSTMVAVTVAIALAITGAAANLIGFFKIIGASFGPICGAMAADYLASGRKWAGPRQGINWAGYLAWAAGFLVGIVDFLPVPPSLKHALTPAVVYSFIVGFFVYAIAAEAGLEPAVVPIESGEPSGEKKASAAA